MSLREFINDFSLKIRQKSPEIAIGFGITGMALAIPLSIIGTIKACDLVKEKKKEENVEALTKKELVKTTWKCYVPTVISFAAGATCVIVSDQIHLKRNTALATAYSLTEKALRTYQEKVIETIGERKEEKIRDDIAKDEIRKNPVSSNEVYVTKGGNTLCYEPISKRYFRSDAESIRKAKDRLNNRMYGGEMFLDLNDYFCELGMYPPDPKYDRIGWCIENGPMDVKLTVAFADDGVTPCIVVVPVPDAKHEYGRDAHLL